MPNSEAVIVPRLTAITKSAIPRTLQTMRAYLDQLYPFFRKYAKGIAVTPTRISTTPAGIPKAGCKIPTDTPQRKAMPIILHVCTATKIEVVLLYCICFELSSVVLPFRFHTRYEKYSL